MKRHQQRDMEAGGPGCGTLDTRKRAWKSSDGHVVEKRFRLTGATNLPSWDSSTIEVSAQVVSPPVSDEGRLNQDFHFDFEEGDHLVDSSGIPQQFAPRYVPQPYFEDYIQPTISTSQPQLSPNYVQPEYQPALQPDTASSFNMPYTTALDYNWLFNLESATASGFGLTSCGSAFQGMSVIQNHEAGRREDDIMTEQPLQDPTPESQTVDSMTSPVEERLDSSRQSQSQSEIVVSSPAPSSVVNTTRESHLHPQLRASRSTKSRVPSPRVNGSRRQQNTNDGVRNSSNNYNNSSWRGLLDRQKPPKMENPLSMLRKPDLLPQISQVARERLLVVVETAKPSIPNQSVDSPVRDHPSLGYESLQSWLDLFFTQFNTAYPLVHVPTFDADEAEPLLLLSLILLGATYGDKNAHQVAVCIHDVIRPVIFAHAGFSPRPELWTLQTILLVECFGKSRAGQKQHDFSHLFHGLLINLIRRSDCQSITESPQPPPEGATATLLNDAWRRWADLEQKKRLALLCFMWDTQHAVLFCQSLCMSAFELRCSMPCAQSLWESSDADSWATAHRRSQSQSSPSNTNGPVFLSTLKAYLSTPTGPRIGRDTNALSLILILHGIMSIAWDMQRRDQTSLGVNTIIGTASWKSLLGQAYDRWKVDFDQYCEEAATAGGPDVAADWKAFAVAYRAVYQAAQALLHMDFLDVQIYAGARHILGRPVQQQDYIRSSRIVKKWASKDRDRAAIAAWHAANMLHDIMAISERDSDQASENGQALATDYTNLFHVPWCLYLATLTAWAFHHARPPRKDREARARAQLDEDEDSSGYDSDTSDEIVWDAQREMESLVREMAGEDRAQETIKEILSSQGRKGTLGLVWIVADHLSKVRWGIVHAGVFVLRGLVPTRLINQYEDS